MNKSVTDSKARIIIGVSFVVNLLLSWTILPLVIPPFRSYSLHDLIEVLLWQGMGTVGWPLALFGGLFSLLLQPKSTGLGALLLLLIYPSMLFLLVLVLRSERPRRWALILLHMLIPFSFAAVWHGVLNGYDFMGG
jgi:hypothetical protein